MFIITDNKTGGVYATPYQKQDKIVCLFEEEDDAERYIDQLKAKDHQGELETTEVEQDLVLHTCIHLSLIHI